MVLCCSSSQRSYDQAMNLLGFRGTLVCLGIPDGKDVPIAGAKVPLMASNEVVIFGKLCLLRDYTRTTAEHM